jgi:hypothetical protein
MPRLPGTLCGAAALIVVANVAFAQSADELSPAAWAQADEVTVRLSPGAFPDVPSAVAAELVRRGCLIPQTYGDRRPHNLISGRFMSSASTDWAVLCSRNRTSSLLVFQAGSPDTVIELAETPDANWLQGIGAGAIGFSRAIGVASPAYILEHYQRYGGPTPPPLEHDGINDAFIEKASVVWYWYGGRWLELQGAD